MHASQRLHPDRPAREAAMEVRAPAGIRRLSVTHFLVALIALLVTMPFVDALANGLLIEAVLITLVLLSAVLAVSGRGRSLFLAVVLVTPAVAGTWIDHFRPDTLPRELTLAAGMVFVVYVIAHLLGFIWRAPRVDFEVLCVAVSTYLMLGILWAFAYTLVARVVPDSFVFTVGSGPNRSMTHFEPLYFSFATLTTVGYGDIIPVSNPARMLAMAQSTTGVFFATILIARLVALYSSGEPTRAEPAQNIPLTGAPHGGRGPGERRLLEQD